MTTHSIKLTTLDGGIFDFACEESESLLDAAARAMIQLPSMCKQGGCGICAVTCAGGEYKMENFNSVVLSSEATALGEILPCRAYPRSDLLLVAPYDSASVRVHRIPERNAKIVAVERTAENVIWLELRLEPDGAQGVAVDFEPGQFMQIAVPNSEAINPDVMRAYSLSNTANWEGRLEFMIRLHPGGVFSEYLTRRARPGATIRVRGPQGCFYLHQNGLRPRWFVAGGTGLAPVLSMLRRMAEYQEPQDACLFFGVNNEAELFALDELERLKKETPRLVVDVRLWRPGGAWKGLVGTPIDGLRTALEGLAAKPNGVAPDVYLCGPPAMIDLGQSLALASGVPAEQIFVERFLVG
jgi:ferredoxin-NADP reductase/ferredoxin